MDDDLPAAWLTANTLRAFSVCADPHLGQRIFSFEFIVRSSFSNFASHFRHVYSYTGTFKLLVG